MDIILLRGRPAVGKTTLAAALSARLGLPILCKDDFYDTVAPAISDHALRNKIAYDLLYRTLDSNADGRVRFLLDFPFQYPTDLPIIRRWCAMHRATLRSIVVTCSDEDLWAARFEARFAHAPAPNRQIGEFTKLRAYFADRGEPLMLQAEPGEPVIDMALFSIEQAADAVAEFITKAAAAKSK